MINHNTIISIAAVSLLWGSAAMAQHTNFVLFGQPNAAAHESPAEHRFVHPVTAPFEHEDAFVTTDVRAWYLYHDFPSSGSLAGGSGYGLAAQIRLALTDSIQLVAYKDGYLNLDTGLIDADGLVDVGAGLKWNFYQDWENQLHVSVGAGYEFKLGNGKVLNNDDELRLWVSANKGFDRLHLGLNANVFLADEKTNGLGNSDRFSWHLHADYYLCDWFSPVIEFNGYHSISDEGQVIPESGADLLNLGGGDDLVTVGIGGEIRPMKNVAIRAAYEMPVTDKSSLFGYRWTISLVWSF